MTRFIFIVAILVFALCGFVARAGTQVNVTQQHNNPSRDGLYIDPAFTLGQAGNLIGDLNFNGTMSGKFMLNRFTSRAGQTARCYSVTESNNVYALNAITGTVIWQRNVSGRRSLQVCRVETQSARHTRHTSCRSRLPIAFLGCNGRWRDQKAFHLFPERGHRRDQAGWPVDVNAKAMYNGIISRP